MVIIVAVASVLAVIGIVYGLMSRKDRGKLEVAVINPANLPFNLFLDDYFLEEYPQLVEAFQHAILFINDTVGHTLFAPLGQLTTGDVIPVMPYDPDECDEASCHEGAFAFTSFDAGKAEAVYVNVDHIDSKDEVELKFGCAHELGHVLGLDHDDFTNSFMYRKILSREPEMTVKDRLFLRLAYGIDDAHRTA